LLGAFAFHAGGNIVIDFGRRAALVLSALWIATDGHGCCLRRVGDDALTWHRGRLTALLTEAFGPLPLRDSSV